MPPATKKEAQWYVGLFENNIYPIGNLALTYLGSDLRASSC